MIQQSCQIYLAGMADDASYACSKINAAIAEGWLVVHMLPLSSGMIMVVYQMGEAPLVPQVVVSRHALPEHRR